MKSGYHGDVSLTTKKLYYQHVENRTVHQIIYKHPTAKSVYDVDIILPENDVTRKNSPAKTVWVKVSEAVSF